MAHITDVNDDGKRYDIVRFRQNGEPEIVRRGFTLAQAQEHCRDSKTHGDGWFDGYTEVVEC